MSRTRRIALVLALVLAALLTLGVVGFEVGPIAFLTGLALAFVPVPIYVALALRIDRFDPEPVRLLAWAFFWGASAATFIALVLNTAGQALVGSQFGSHVGEIYGGSVSAPLVEESAKAAVLFAIYRWRRHELDGVLDGIIYAAMVGLGFAMTENVLYYSHAAGDGGVPLAATFFLRGLMSPFAHPLFTSMTGIGLGIAATTRRRWLRTVAPVGGLLLAAALHSLWNTASTLGDGAAFFGVYLLVMVPVFSGLLAVAAVSARRDADAVRQQLQPEVAAGRLTPGDVEMLASLRDRRRMRKAAKKRGREAKQAVRDFQSAATELALSRRRKAHGLPVLAAIDESALSAGLGPLREALPDTIDPVREAAEKRAAIRSQLAWVRQPPAAGRVPNAALAPPGWYLDPWRQSHWRWWDGREWTGHAA